MADMAFAFGTPELWLGLGGGVIAFFAVVPVVVRHRRRRSRTRRREAYELPELIKMFDSPHTGDPSCIEEIIRTYAELYGVAPGQARPEDALTEKDGRLSSLVLDDTYVTFVDTLQSRMRQRFGVGWRPSAAYATLGDLIRAFPQDVRPGPGSNTEN